MNGFTHDNTSSVCSVCLHLSHTNPSIYLVKTLTLPHISSPLSPLPFPCHLTLSFFPPQAPSGAPTNVTADCQTHAVVVSWCVPVKKDRNGRITGFEVELHCPGQVTQRKQVTRKKRCESATFGELLAGKTYQVRVKAFNGAGEGPFSEFLQAKTKETGKQVLFTLSVCARACRVCTRLAKYSQVPVQPCPVVCLICALCLPVCLYVCMYVHMCNTCIHTVHEQLCCYSQMLCVCMHRLYKLCNRFHVLYNYVY